MHKCICVWCGREFEAQLPHAKYCPTGSCKRKTIYQRHREKELKGQQIYRERVRASRVLEPPKHIGRPFSLPREHHFIAGIEHTTCTTCKQLLPLDCFGKKTCSKDGLCSQCKQCEFEARKEGQKAYYNKHKKQIKKYKSEWEKEKKKDPEYRERRKQFLEEWKNRPESKERYQKWYSENKDRYMARSAKRRTRKKNLLATLTAEEWEECLRYFDNKDAYTGLPMKIISQDHVIPLSKGGAYINSNIIPCEKSVNSSKSNVDMQEWYRIQPFFSETRLKKILKWTGLNPNSAIQQINMF